MLYFRLSPYDIYIFIQECLMLRISVSLRCLGWMLGCLALAVGLFGGHAPVAAQTDSSPTFGAAPEVALIFLVGSAQTARLPTATGGDGSLTYTLDPTTPLPAGLAFDAAPPAVSGTAQASQAAETYQLVATDADGDMDRLSFTLAVNAQPSFPAGEPALTFMAGTAQTSAALPMATGGDGALTYAIDPTAPLPAGLAFNATDRTVAASATAGLQLAATYRLVATDADGDMDQLAFTIAVEKDYDANNNRLVDITTLAQLDAVRYDLDGTGGTSSASAAYTAAFPHAARNMGCSGFCAGYELMTDLDFDQNGDGRITSADAAYWNNGAGWKPIGPDSGDRPFSGIFQGNGHVISHLFIHRSADAYVGLFARVSQRYRTEGRGRVVDLILQDVQIWGDQYVGGIAGLNNGEIAAGSVSGTVTGSNNRVGGLAGHNSGAITASTASASIAGTQSVGGLAGSNDGAIVVSYATGTVTGSGDEIGGLAGNNTDKIISSYATGTVMGRSGAHVGGLVGHNDGAITASYATGLVITSGSQAGGLAGTNAASGRIAASYATGAVTSAQAVGGLVGDNQGAVVASYAAGSVAGGTRVGGLAGNNQGQGAVVASYARGAVSGRTQVGGLVGTATAPSAITASYWDTTASGQTASRGGTGQTTQALQAPTAYAGLYAAWNVDVDGRAGADAPWDFGTASQYPVLQYDCLCSVDQQR